MKRVGGLFAELTSFESLLRAYCRACRGKRGRPGVERFARRLESELLQLQAELRTGDYRPGPYVLFQVFDPKERTIAVAPFRDRVVHHAVIGALEPYLERMFDFDSYGCRVGKGTDGALTRALALARRFPFCLKTDVRQFFASVGHDVLLGQVERKVKDRALLDVLGRIIHHGGHEGRGLPIGNLTSQWLANLYLTPLDRFVRKQIGVGGYVRYMDDVLVMGRDAATLRGVAHAMAAFIDDELHLTLKQSVTQVYPSSDGFPFLGLRVRASGIEVRRPTWRRFVQRKRRREWEYRTGRRELAELQASVGSMLAHLERSRTRGIRRTFFLAAEREVEW